MIHGSVMDKVFQRLHETYDSRSFIATRKSFAIANGLSAQFMHICSHWLIDVW